MSKSIEERIVQMSFKNDNFQKNVADTMSSLDKLKAGLDMSGVKGKFAELSGAASAVNLSGLSNQVEGIKSQFSNLQVVALGALATIGSKLVDLGIQWGKNALGSMTQSARSGFAEYELKMGSIQTMLANTSKYGTTLDEVNASLDVLNQYADKTIYNFGDMTKNIGLFTNAGLRLEDATSMIKGFSNAAAASGTSSQGAAGAAYQLSQALSAGTIRLMDWRSLTNVGMGNKNMQEGIIGIAEAMGRFRETGDDANVVAADFNSSLESNWLSADVMSTYLKIMAEDTYESAKAMALATGLSEAQADALANQAVTANEAATKVRTLTQLMGTLSEAAGSSWSESFQILFGNFAEATDLFTLLSDEIGGYVSASGDARNAQLQLWKDMGGYSAIVEAISNAFQALHRILDPITSAFREVFPPSWGATLANISFAIRDFTAGLIISEKASANIGKVFKLAFTGIKAVLDVVSGGFRIFFALIGAGFRLLGSLIGLVTPLIGFLINLIPPAKEAGEATESFADKAVKLINGGIGPLIEWLQKLGTAFSDFLNGLNAADKVSTIVENLRGVAAAVAMVYNVLAKGDFTGNPFFSEDSKFVDVLFKIRAGAIAVGDAIGNFFGNIKTTGKAAGDIISNVWGYLTGIAKDAGPAFAKIGQAIEKAMSGIQIEHVLAALNTGVLLAVGVGFKKMFDSIRGVFDGAAGIFDGIKDALGSIGGVLEGMQKKLKADALIRIAGAIGILAISLAILAGIDPDRLMSAAIGMGTALGAMIVATKILNQIAETSAKDTAKMVLLGVALIQFAVAVTIMAQAVKTLSQLSWEELLKGTVTLGVVVAMMSKMAEVLSKQAKDMATSAFGLILMSTAILALAGAVAIFGNMPLETLAQGGIAVAVALAALVGAAVIISKFAKEMAVSSLGLMAFAAALNMLVVPILALGLIPFPILQQGMLAVGIALTGLVIAANMMSQLGPKMAVAAVGLMAFAVAINLLVAPIVSLGMLPFETLITGLIGVGAAVAIMVVAANAMTGAIVGAGAMIVMAGAIIILATAIQIIGSMPIEQVLQGILGIAGGMLIVGAAAALLGVAAPLLLLGAAGLLVVGVAMVAMAGAVVIFAVGLAMLGPALLIASGGLMAFAAVAPKIAEAVPAFLGIGAGLLVFGAGAAVAGAGVLVLGAGLAVLGAGLALVGIFGPIGTIALTAFVLALGKLAGEMPNMLAMSAVFITLGAGTLALGVGMTALGVGGLLAGVALIALIPMGALITASFALITNAINKLIPQSEKLGQLGTNFDGLGKAINKVGAAGSGAAAGMAATASGFNAMNNAAMNASSGVTSAGSMMVVVLAAINTSGRTTATGFNSSMQAMGTSLNSFKMGLSSSAGPIEAAAKQIGRSVGPAIIHEVNSSAGGMSSAGYNVGRAITDGMANGVRSGQNNVTNAARQVAQSALNASKATLGVRSPSREYFKIGGFQSEGQALGMLDGMSMVTNAAEDLGKGAIKALQNSLSGYGAATMLDVDMEPVIRPVIDLSNIKAGSDYINGMFNNPHLDVEGMRNNANETRSAIQQTEELQYESASEEVAPIQFTQINNSPKALSNAEIYRRTKNQLSVAKGALTTANAKPS